VSVTGGGRVAVKALLFAGETRVFGPGKADLLAAIDRTGSISAAARTLGLSYRRAWLLVDAMNRDFGEPLVATASTGATLSDAGRAALAAYRRLEAAVSDAADVAGGELLAMLAPRST